MQETQIKNIELKEQNPAQKTLNSVLKDYENITAFMKDGIILKGEIAYKPTSEKLSDMAKLSKGINNPAVLILFAKRQKATANRGLNATLKEQEQTE